MHPYRGMAQVSEFLFEFFFTRFPSIPLIWVSITGSRLSASFVTRTLVALVASPPPMTCGFPLFPACSLLVFDVGQGQQEPKKQNEREQTTEGRDALLVVVAGLFAAVVGPAGGSRRGRRRRRRRRFCVRPWKRGRKKRESV